ncbi:hypothetical protein IM660_16985 [Ruania alkalisoli]|uniref:LppM domain-containing protein n=1 Tax=Ruania alkalisoli TaxID=2779775 RepID=A0A7M1SRU1_9MICO|nr:hypothetical protein [Ruania alkalisoli]QOR70278.1 hypothetical protein IM660_16985 [Ruania alkalisoli]
MKLLLRLLLTLASLLLLAGCFRVEGDLTIAPDAATVSGEVTVVVSRAWAQENGEDLDAMVSGIESDLAAAPDQGVTAEPYDDGEYAGVRLTLTETPVDRLEAATSGALSITSDDQEIAVVAGLGSLAEADADGWETDLSITFPDGVTRHDGEREGSTVTWHLNAEDSALRATGPMPGARAPFPWVTVSAGLVLVSGVSFALIQWRQRRQRGSAPVERD